MRNFMGDEECSIWIHVCLCKDALSGYDGLAVSIMHCRGNNTSVSQLMKFYQVFERKKNPTFLPQEISDPCKYS